MSRYTGDYYGRIGQSCMVSILRKRTDLFVWIAFVAAAAVFCTSMYAHLFAADFDYLVEAECDAGTQTCYVRDCEADECPPNGLSSYTLYVVPARDFAQCTDNACSNVCLPGGCEEIRCSDETDECSHPGAYTI